MSFEPRRPSDFDGGPERAAYEANWPDWLQTEFAAVVLGYPAAVRPWLQRKRVARLDAGRTFAPGEVSRLAEEIGASLRVDALEPVSA